MKEGLRVVPIPFKLFRRQQHSSVYFEIYNLTRDAFGQTRYRVVYTLRSPDRQGMPARILRGLGRALRLTEKGREIVIAYDQAGDKSDETAYVALDLSGTEPGGQLVRFKVTDLHTEQKISKEIAFQIVH